MTGTPLRVTFPDQKTAIAYFTGTRILHMTELFSLTTGDDSPIHSDSEHQRFFDDNPELAASLKDVPRHFMIHGKVIEGVTVALFRRQFRQASYTSMDAFLLSGSTCTNLCPVYFGDVVSYEVTSFTKTGRLSKNGFHEYRLTGEAHKTVGGRRIPVLRFELTGALYDSFPHPIMP